MNKNGNEMRKPFQDFADGFAAGARALAGAVAERDDKGDADLLAQIASLKSELSAAQSHRARNLVAQSNREGDLEGEATRRADELAERIDRAISLIDRRPVYISSTVRGELRKILNGKDGE